MSSRPWESVCRARKAGPRVKPSIQDVKNKHAARLLALPGVVSVGIGRDDGGNPVLVIGLQDSRPETLAAVPDDLEGFSVQKQVTGPIRAG